MDINDWNLLLGKIPPANWVSHAPASSVRIQAVETLVGRKLPHPFRSFLQVSDGASFGDRKVLGTRDLLLFLQKGHSLPGLEYSSTELRKTSGLLPFHPVSRTSFECLDLRKPEAPIVWVRMSRVHAVNATKHWSRAGKPEAFDEIAGRSPKAITPRMLLSMEPTYLDFLDWFLDLLWTLHHPEQDLELRVQNPDRRVSK